MFEAAMAALLLLVVELFLFVSAWKFRRGQWLRLIAGNILAAPKEMERPYQRRMGRDVSNVFVLCAVGLPFLFGLVYLVGEGHVDRNVAFAAMTLFCLTIVASGVAVSIRAQRAAREEDRRAGSPEPSEIDRRLDRSQTAVALVLVAVMLGISLAGAFLAS